MEELTQLEKHFNALYTSYYNTKVISYPDMLVYYKIPMGYAKQTAKEINDIIERLGLPLVAKENASNVLFHDSICVTEKTNEK